MKNLLFLTAVLTLFITAGNSSAAYAAEDAMELGKLYFVNLKEGEQPIMTGLSLFGNRCGTGDFNKKPFAAEGIRSIFELDEWIEFYPQSNAGTGIKVMVFKHKADQGFYPKNTLNEAFELGMKQQLKKKGIKGQLTFGLKPDGVDVQGNPYDLIDQITINLDN